MFNPVNRYILIEVPTTKIEDIESMIVLPQDYKPQEERFGTVTAIASAPDVRFSIAPSTDLVVDRGMIEEIKIGGTIYNVILDNYIVGIIA